MTPSDPLAMLVAIALGATFVAALIAFGFVYYLWG
jgi:hypothetical protein